MDEFEREELQDEIMQFMTQSTVKSQVKGYTLFSPECSGDENWDDDEEWRPQDNTCDSQEDMNDFSAVDTTTTSFSDWIAASILPRFTDQISVSSNMSVIESALDSFTTYRELREACLDSQFEQILARLQAEWYYVGGSVRSRRRSP